ncbi:hypothetical protein [Bradyrhizobium sp. USDA 4350]
MTKLYVAGEHISAGQNVVFSATDGKVYAAGANARSYATFVGVAVEQLREGFRVAASDAGEVREDDA